MLYLNGGASKGYGNEFDDISLVYEDRGGFICQFCRVSRSGLRTADGNDREQCHFDVSHDQLGARAGSGELSGSISEAWNQRWKTKQALRTSVKLKKLLPASSYEYQVATVCSGETSPYSAVQAFTTNP